MSSESNIRMCKVCSQPKQRILDGKYPDGKNKKYVDENGLKWNGSCCPNCQKAKAKESMKSLRFQRAITKVTNDDRI